MSALSGRDKLTSTYAGANILPSVLLTFKLTECQLRRGHHSLRQPNRESALYGGATAYEITVPNCQSAQWTMISSPGLSRNPVWSQVQHPAEHEAHKEGLEGLEGQEGLEGLVSVS